MVSVSLTIGGHVYQVTIASDANKFINQTTTRSQCLFERNRSCKLPMVEKYSNRFSIRSRVFVDQRRIHSAVLVVMQRFVLSSNSSCLIRSQDYISQALINQDRHGFIVAGCFR